MRTWGPLPLTTLILQVQTGEPKDHSPDNSHILSLWRTITKLRDKWLNHIVPDTRQTQHMYGVKPFYEIGFPLLIQKCIQFKLVIYIFYRKIKHVRCRMKVLTKLKHLFLWSCDWFIGHNFKHITHFNDSQIDNSILTLH